MDKGFEEGQSDSSELDCRAEEVSYRIEILAEDIDEAPGGLWTRKTIEDARVQEAPVFNRIVVAVDPSATSTGDDAGIMVVGKYKDDEYY